MNSPTIALHDNGTHLVVQFPGHAVNVPMDDRGWEVIRTVLQARADESVADWNKGIGTAAQPTQDLINDWLRNNTVTKVAVKADAAMLAEIFGDEELDLEISL